MTGPCEMELCPNWSGDGRVCPCVLFDLDPPEPLRCEADYNPDGGNDGVCLARLNADGTCPRQDDHDQSWVEGGVG